MICYIAPEFPDSARQFAKSQGWQVTDESDVFLHALEALHYRERFGVRLAEDNGVRFEGLGTVGGELKSDVAMAVPL